VALIVAVSEIQLSRRVIINYSVARHLLCTPLCYANVYTVIERYRAHATRNYSIRRQITSYLSGERSVKFECINKVFYYAHYYAKVSVFNKYLLFRRRWSVTNYVDRLYRIGV